MILFKKGITKALIRLRGCAGWYAPLLFANPCCILNLKVKFPIFSETGDLYGCPSTLKYAHDLTQSFKYIFIYEFRVTKKAFNKKSHRFPFVTKLC